MAVFTVPVVVTVDAADADDAFLIVMEALADGQNVNEVDNIKHVEVDGDAIKAEDA